MYYPLREKRNYTEDVQVRLRNKKQRTQDFSEYIMFCMQTASLNFTISAFRQKGIILFYICTVTYNYTSHKPANGYLPVSRKDRVDHLVSNNFISKNYRTTGNAARLKAFYLYFNVEKVTNLRSFLLGRNFILKFRSSRNIKFHPTCHHYISIIATEMNIGHYMSFNS